MASISPPVTQLYHAIQQGNITAAIEIASSNPALINDYNNTPLHIACFKGMTEIASGRLHLGADMFARNFKNDTTLHIAAKSQASDVIKMLVEDFGHGMIDVKGFKGGTQLHVACRKGKIETDNREISLLYRSTR